MLEMWNERERALIATDPERVPGLANPPSAGTAHMGQMRGEARDKAAAEGARTVPPREHGGNCDIKDLSRGAKVFFPVYVDGAGLSVGDLHFSQGDGEITFWRRHRDGGLGAHEGQPHQGRHGQVRHQEPHLQAQPHHAAL